MVTKAAVVMPHHLGARPPWLRCLMMIVSVPAADERLVWQRVNY
jgi:hypothetical protein